MAAPGLLSGIAYVLLGLEGLRQVAESRKKEEDARIEGLRSGALGGWAASAGRTISAAQMRAQSPVFRRPARATLGTAPTIATRVARIRDLIRKGSEDPAVRRTAGIVLARRCPDRPGGWCLKEKDWQGEAAALFHFVRKNIRYTRDHPKLDVFVHPARTLFDVAPGSGGIGDCDDYAITLGALLRSVGHDLVARVGAVINDASRTPPFNHIWLVDKLPLGGAVARAGGREYPLDASVDKPPGWQAPKERLYQTRDFPI